MKKHLLLTLAFLLFVNVVSFAQNTVPSANAVMKDAYTQAKKENKKVLLMFHASWCGWCKKMDASIEDPTCKKFFYDNYVITHLDVLERPGKTNLENAGSLDQLKAFKGEKSGLPFWVILDDKGKLLADSKVRPQGASLQDEGQSMGCPAEDSEIAYFIKLLKASSKLTNNQLAIISKRFALNNPEPVKPVTKAASSK